MKNNEISAGYLSPEKQMTTSLIPSKAFLYNQKEIRP